MKARRARKEMTGEVQVTVGTEAAMALPSRALRWDISDPHPCSVYKATKEG